MVWNSLGFAEERSEIKEEEYPIFPLVESQEENKKDLLVILKSSDWRGRYQKRKKKKPREPSQNQNWNNQ